ncbi:relaxase/mobilization nuclease domain-containing protein (plasmid) [Agrobacterium tumefaciens]|uniref:Relaxase/mobilization nuclease domain-containing protein n=1 Tax=Agrobacterium tumefaciens TaxID=358 RepID=A0AAJ4TDE6_AGRTU|nr:relaxase/mobilization nuclease domain-containing protein [Agrobacterium tumefaciens]
MPDLAQVIIRIVPGGGTKTLQQIINQWEYLSRKGELELRLSARHLDIPLPPDQIHEFARSWVQETGTYDESRPDEERQQELTTHIIVSFPAGTSQVAAHAASREWAAEMFGSGEGGGCYNYLTAFHVDRDHPHLHVVVNRRELLGQGWLKISRRHPQLNYDALRIKMAEISLRYGILLDASSRAERGITERPITYAEYRRLEREQARQIRFEDADLEQSPPQRDHPELNQPSDPSPFEASAGGSERMPRSANRQNGSQAHLQELAEFRSETDARSDIPRSATDAVTHTTYDRQRRSKRPGDNDGGPSGAKRARLDGIEVEFEANAGKQDGCSDPVAPQAETSRRSSLLDTAKASTATNPLSATDHLQQRRGAPSKRPREDDDGEPNERKRASSQNGRGGDRR